MNNGKKDNQGQSSSLTAPNTDIYENSGDSIASTSNRNPPILPKSLREIAAAENCNSPSSEMDSADEHDHLLADGAHGQNSENELPRLNFRSSTPADITIPRRGLLTPEAKSWWAYYIPAMTWIPKYKARYLIGDICAGITLATFQIPLAMSYANSLAFVPTVCGLYGLVIPPLVYSIMGSVPQMIVGPEGAISLVVGQAVTPYIQRRSSASVTHSNPTDLDPAEVASMLSAIAGLLLFAAGLLRFGYLDSILSRALLRGFISAVGLVMVIDQFPAMLGLEQLMHEVTGTHPSTAGKCKFLAEYWREAHPLTAYVSFVALAAILIMRLIKRKYQDTHKALVFLPEILIVVVIASWVCWFFGFDDRGVEVLGPIKPGKLSISFPFKQGTWPDFKENFSASFFAAILGFFESTIAAKALGSLYDYNISTNRELVALGTINMAGSLFSALPSFGGYGRSKVNAVSGAKSQMSSVVLAIVTILSIAFLMPYFYHLPKCVLSSVILAVGISLLEEAPADIKFYAKIGGYEDLFTLSLTLVATMFWSVQTGIAVGIGFSLMRVIHHATRPRIQILGRIPGTNIFRNADENLQYLETAEGCLIVKIPEPLTFANTGDLGNRLKRLEQYGSMRVHPSHPRINSAGLSYLIIDLRGMTECDASAVYVLHELVEQYVSRGVLVVFTRFPLDKNIRDMFMKSGIYQLVSDNSDGHGFFDNIEEALIYIDRQV